MRDADLLTPGDQPYILEFSAGNAGPGSQTIGSPAVGKNVIATGASQNDRFNLPIEEFTIYADGPDAMADFSSRGPCEDGRIKPDVVAPGTWIASLRSIYANDENAWWPISDNYLYHGRHQPGRPARLRRGGGLRAVLPRNHTNATPSPALVKAALINSATDMDDGSGHGSAPNMDEGWGRVDLPQLIGAPRDLEFVDQTVPLSPRPGVRAARGGGQRRTSRSRSRWPTPTCPGFPGSSRRLVNDLDLEVVGARRPRLSRQPVRRRRVRARRAGRGHLNNVEGVLLATPVAGRIHRPRDRARQVVEDARVDTPAGRSGFRPGHLGLPSRRPGDGIVTFDRPAYTAPGLIRLTLVDHGPGGPAHRHGAAAQHHRTRRRNHHAARQRRDRPVHGQRGHGHRPGAGGRQPAGQPRRHHRGHLLRMQLHRPRACSPPAPTSCRP